MLRCVDFVVRLTVDSGSDVLRPHHWRELYFKFQLGFTPVLDSIIFFTGLDVQSEVLSHWFLLLFVSVGLHLTQGRLSSVEGHSKVFNRSNVLDCALQSVLTLEHRPSVIEKLDGHIIWRLCGNRSDSIASAIILTVNDEIITSNSILFNSKFTYGRQLQAGCYNTGGQDHHYHYKSMWQMCPIQSFCQPSMKYQFRFLWGLPQTFPNRISCCGTRADIQSTWLRLGRHTSLPVWME